MDSEKFKVKVDADNNLGIAVFLIFAIVATHGDPDLLDVLARWCKLWLDAHP